jgi:hypothetical protein
MKLHPAIEYCDTTTHSIYEEMRAIFVASTADFIITYKILYYSKTDGLIRLIFSACTSLLVFFNVTLSFCPYQVYYSIW